MGLQKKRNCGLPKFGGADPNRKERVYWAGSILLDPNQPGGPTKTLHSVTECPKSFITEESSTLLTLYIASHVGTNGQMILPEPGGLFDQPTVIMDAFNIIRHEHSLFEKEQRDLKDRERAAKKNASPDRPMQNTTIRH